MEVRFLTTKNEFLDSASHLLMHDEDDIGSVGDLSFLWGLLDDIDYSMIIAQALTTEIVFRGRTTNHDCQEYDEIYGKYVNRLNQITRTRERKARVVFFEELDFSSFIYALLDHFSGWVDELNSVDVEVTRIVKRGERFDISFT